MPTTQGPIFTQADFEAALSKLDLILQDHPWEPGEVHFLKAALLSALGAKGITLALAEELFARLIDQKVFTPWTEVIPGGISYEQGLQVLRSEPEVTDYLTTTQDRWYGYLAEWRRERESAVDVPKKTLGEKPESEWPKRNKKREARDRWIYKRCCKGTPHDEIVAELRRIAPGRDWPIVSTKQRIRQIGIEFAKRNDKRLPPPRQNL
jgi:hypothetical protein